MITPQNRTPAVYWESLEMSEKIAFINGKLDLVQVEAVASLINSKSIENTRHQQKILRGTLSLSINNLRTKIVSLLGRLEHQMDIDEEDWPSTPPSWLAGGVDAVYWNSDVEKLSTMTVMELTT